MSTGLPIVIIRTGSIITRGALQAATEAFVYLSCKGTPTKIATSRIDSFFVTGETDSIREGGQL